MLLVKQLMPNGAVMFGPLGRGMVVTSAKDGLLFTEIMFIA